MLEMNLGYWGIMREMTQLRSEWARQSLLLQKGVPQRVWLASTPNGKSTQVFTSPLDWAGFGFTSYMVD
jgi:hypothetical protein